MDHCTLWPDTIAGIYIGACCAAHDAAYINGADRLPADRALAECVAGLGLPFTGFVMGLAVTWFGWIFYRRRK